MELAAELLEVTNEAELDRFLGRLFRRVGGFFRRVIRSPIVRAIGGVLRNVARRVLPLAGGALGSIVAPGIGTAIGSSLGSAVGQLFGAELEGLSPEDREFEVARRFVRLAASTIRRAAFAPPNVPPEIVARRSFYAAARRYAPGLVVITPIRGPVRSGTVGAAPGAIPAGVPAGAPGPRYYRPAGATPGAPPPVAQAMPGAATTNVQPPAAAGGQWPRFRRWGRWFRRGNSIILVGAYGAPRW